ncbi:hypothetical protein BDW62DRAFT_201891 [Aspergillus aurantiobrunneus]
MECATYASMCDHCKFQYLKIREQGEPAPSLEYHPDTYPIVFKCMFEFPTDAFELAERHARTCLLTVKHRLHKRYKKPVAAFIDYQILQEVEAGGLLVTVSLLIDFPCRGLADGQFKSWLGAVTTLSRGLEDWSSRIEVEEGLKEDLLKGLGVHFDHWDAYITSTQDHLCMARLCWFLKRAGMVAFI